MFRNVGSCVLPPASGLQPPAVPRALALREQLVVPVQRFHKSLQLLERARIHDDVVRNRQALLARRLGGENAPGLVSVGLIARRESPDLVLFGAIDDEHAIIDVRATGFGQEGDHMDLVAAAGRVRASRQFLTNGRVSDRLELLALRWIPEDLLPHARAIQATRRVEDVAAELCYELRKRRRSRLDDVSRNLIRIEHGDAELREVLGDGALAARDAAGERDEKWTAGGRRLCLGWRLEAGGWR